MKRRAFLTRASAVAGLGLASATARAGTADRIPDVEVRSHDGGRFRFYRDLVQGRIATFNFMFTSCGET